MAKILIVEDDPILISVYETVLKKEGHTVELALDGEEALARAKSFKPDLILLDVMIPKLDGIEFLRRYNPKQHPETKIIVFSNLTLPEKTEEALKLGVTTYVTKADYTPRQLSDMIKQTLAS